MLLGNMGLAYLVHKVLLITGSGELAYVAPGILLALTLLGGLLFWKKGEGRQIESKWIALAIGSFLLNVFVAEFLSRRLQM